MKGERFIDIWHRIEYMKKLLTLLMPLERRKPNEVLQIVVPILGLILLMACDSNLVLEPLLDNDEAAKLTGDGIVGSIGDDWIISDGNVGGPTFPWVYDAWDYLENLPPDLPILTVYDLKDKVVPNEGILPFFEKADKLNLPLVKLVLIESDDQIDHHGDMVQLFEILTRPENRNFHPVR